MSTRVPIPEDVAADVLFQHDHTCCVCNIPGKSIQIHHIDEVNSNNDPNNLAVLCLEDHNARQVRGGFGRRLGAGEIIKYRDAWILRVRDRKVEADKLAIGRVAGIKNVEELDEKWQQPSLQLLAAYIESLPEVLRSAYQQARKLWDSGVTWQMMDGNRLVIDVLEQSWVHLSRWLSPRHFGERSAAEYFSGYIAARYTWNYALQDPEADGRRGFGVGIFVGHDTLVDIEEAVAESALTLGEMFVNDFDKTNWQRRWMDAKQ